MNDAAPIVQLLLTAQFQPAASTLSIFDYADLRGVFPDYPIHRQVPAAGPMPVLQHGPIFGIVSPSEFRVQLLTEDLQWSVLFQGDRISCGWNRTNPLGKPSGYPGFVTMLERFSREVERLSGFIVTRGSEPIRPLIGEVSYSDAFLLKDGESAFRLEDLFVNVRSIEEFRFSNVDLTYTRILGGDYPSHVETNISGPNTAPTGESAMFLRTVVRFMVEDAMKLNDRFDHAHIAAQDVFRTLVKPESYAISDS